MTHRLQVWVWVCSKVPTGYLCHCLWPATPVTGTIWWNTNYFEHAGALQQGLYPLSPLPFRTIVQGKTALHLTRNLAMKMLIEAIIERFNLLGLHGALADFLTQFNGKHSFHIGGHRISNINSLLPFDNLQVWTKVQVQNHSYFSPHHIHTVTPMMVGKDSKAEASMSSSFHVFSSSVTSSQLILGEAQCLMHPDLHDSYRKCFKWTNSLINTSYPVHEFMRTRRSELVHLSWNISAMASISSSEYALRFKTTSSWGQKYNFLISKNQLIESYSLCFKLCVLMVFKVSE